MKALWSQEQARPTRYLDSISDQLVINVESCRNLWYGRASVDEAKERRPWQERGGTRTICFRFLSCIVRRVVPKSDCA